MTTRNTVAVYSGNVPVELVAYYVAPISIEFQSVHDKQMLHLVPGKGGQPSRRQYA